MSAPAFTPGPWRAATDTRLYPWTDAVNIMAEDFPGHEIWLASTTRGFEGDGTEGNSQALANANLIAAAPELYEAAEELAGMTCQTTGAEDAESGCCSVCRARKAVAKARGESPSTHSEQQDRPRTAANSISAGNSELEPDD